jgi:hypothetical protein
LKNVAKRQRRGRPQWCGEQRRQENTKFLFVICTDTYRNRVIDPEGKDMHNSPVLQAITALCEKSAIVSYEWRDRGEAPAGYLKGMAVMFGRCYCKLKKGDEVALDMAKANTGDENTDALSWYADQFQLLGMSNRDAGTETLRHVFVLLTGLGMRETGNKPGNRGRRSATWSFGGVER